MEDSKSPTLNYVNYTFHMGQYHYNSRVLLSPLYNQAYKLICRIGHLKTLI